MFSKELENLIQATLEDGVLEEYEKAALVKRAQAEGVDLTEMEIYINSILQKRQKEFDKEKKAKIEKIVQEKKEAFGRVCPSCGKQVSSMTLKCECGFEFTTAQSSSSAQLLLEKIEKINLTYPSDMNEREKQICDTIELFPVPNTKEDILEFLSMAVSILKINCPSTIHLRVELFFMLLRVFSLLVGLLSLHYFLVGSRIWINLNGHYKKEGKRHGAVNTTKLFSKDVVFVEIPISKNS